MDKKPKFDIRGYLQAREAIGKAQGYFRCEEMIKGLKRCDMQCVKCSEYYDEKK